MNNFYSQNKTYCFFPPGDNPINIVIFLEEALFKFRYQYLMKAFGTKIVLRRQNVIHSVAS